MPVGDILASEFLHEYVVPVGFLRVHKATDGALGHVILPVVGRRLEHVLPQVVLQPIHEPAD